jgi:ATP-binding cassette subfamily F protein 3
LRAEIMLDLLNLAKSFGGQRLFTGLTLRILEGDRIGLVGPNGAGKTTLLRILVGEEHADDGTITRQKDLRVGYLPQEVLRVPDTTVLEHVLTGREDLLALAAELDHAEAQLTAASEHDAAHHAARHADVLERYQTHEAYALEGRAKEILSGLGFRAAQVTAPLASLSGGWGMRVELARLLLARPDLLLLDEPTNHLDLQSLDWLEGFLADYPGAWLVVSHDRYFLNRMVTSIAELTPAGALVFPGNYDDYLEARDELEARLASEQAAVARRVAELQSFIDRFGAKNTKARQAQSRAKQIAKLEKTARARAETAPPPPRRPRLLKLELPVPPRTGDTVVSLSGVRKAYGEHVVYPCVDLLIRRGERLALVGENGAGKSTLLKMVAGVLDFEAGERKLGHNVELFYFAQHQTELLDPASTVLEEMRALLPLEAESRVRGLLGAFLFSGDAVEKKVAVLSGGEKSRLVLAKMLARPASFLLLDEPTNHLDLAARDVVEAALAAFPGTICFISHDRYFINRVATRVIEVQPGGLIADYPGDYDYYLWKKEQAAEAAPAQTTGEPADDPTSERNAGRDRDREARKAAQRESSRRAKEAARLEAEIHAAERRVQEIDALLCDPGIHADGARVRALSQERRDLESRLPPLYELWETAAS